MKKIPMSFVFLSLYLTVAFFDVVYFQFILICKGGAYVKHTYYGVLQLFLLLLLLISNYKKASVPRWILYLTSMVYLYLLVVVVRTAFGLNLTVLGAIRNIWAYWAYVILLPILFCLRGLNQSKRLFEFLTFMFVLNLLVGLFQFVFNAPFWITRSSKGLYDMYAVTFDGHVRATGLFAWPIELGYYLSFMAPLLFTYAFYSRGSKRLVYIVLFVLALLLAYFNLTRSTYLMVALTVVSILLVQMRSVRVLYFAPMLYAVLALVVVIYAPAISAALGHGGIMSDASVAQRTGEWQKALNLWSRDWGTVFFGTGLTQGGQAQSSGSILIDNSFVAMLLQSGVIGLSLYLSVIYIVYMYILKRVFDGRTFWLNAEGRAIAVGALSFMSITFAAFVTNLNFKFPFLMLVLILSSVPHGLTKRC